MLDVALDIRPNSKTYGEYISIELSEDNKQMLFIPEGFAHGFVALSDEVELLYNTSNEYSKDSERGIIWNDKTLSIDWGIDFEPLISDKDKLLPCFLDINKMELI